MLGTKLRALYQRRKGHDLFDLWLCLSRKMLDPQRAVACFNEYIKREGIAVSRAEFELNLRDKQDTPAFLDDIKPLLRADVQYDALAATQAVREVLIEKLPGGPWRGAVA